eukprot:COSAG05_NODE_1183_length_5592_cov_2.043328_5_plen_147_part_00
MVGLRYEACDELGIMVYHDMQYAQGGHSPKNDAVQDAELRHQIRRLASHPSIVMWDGCNECRVIIGTGTGIYATFVMTVVAEEDKVRRRKQTSKSKSKSKSKTPRAHLASIAGILSCGLLVCCSHRRRERSGRPARRSAGPAASTA